jgi:hypothetical protein
MGIGCPDSAILFYLPILVSYQNDRRSNAYGICHDLIT